MQQILKTSDDRDRYFARNTAGISLVELFWGIGLTVLVESTFLQIFLKDLGAGHRTIGIVPAIFSSGMALSSLLSSYLTYHLQKKRGSVILSHCFSGVPIIAIGLVLIIAGRNRYSVKVFIALYSLYSLSIGFIMPVWQSFLMKIFSESRAIPAVSIMMIVQTTGRLLGGIFIVKLVSSYALSPVSSGILFVIIGFIFFSASFFYLLVKENNDERTDIRAHSVSTLTLTLRGIVTERNFMYFLLASLEPFACIAVISFYANYAVECRGIDRALAAGLFTVFIYTGVILANIVFGWFGLFRLKTKYIISRFIAIGGIILLLFTESLTGFLAVSVFLGLSRGISMLAYTPAVKLLSGRHDATDYYAAAPIITLPISFGIPLVCGLFLESYTGNSSSAYHYMFIGLAFLILISIIMIGLTDFNERR
jgi:hypothetical protein